MTKTFSLLLAIFLCLCLCACGNKNIASESFPVETLDDPQDHVGAEYLSMVCGRWDFSSGWRDLGWVLEFRENGACSLNEEELTWDTQFKTKEWLDESKEFINVYRNSEPIYEAHINITEDGTITLVISETDNTGLGIVPAGTYTKLSDGEQPMARNEE